jgi:hypothetical protein
MGEYNKWSVTVRHCEMTYTIEIDSVYLTQETWVETIRSLTVLIIGESAAEDIFGD